MASLYKRIGFIGAGNMGEAILGALIGSDIASPENISVSDISEDRLKWMRDTYGVGTLSDNGRLFRESDIVVLAVKPQQMDTVLNQIVAGEGDGFENRKLVISIAAGVRMEKIEGHLYKGLDPDRRKQLPIIRVMPNTPALVQAGISGMSPNRYAAEADLDTARTLLKATGKVITFEEPHLDAVTGLSGSGPAYVFYLIEAMTAGGIRAGLSPEDAAELTVATVDGAVRLLMARGESPETLRKKVTSPGGTTEAALGVLNAHQVGRRIADAVVVAAERAEELSR
jgi:pyrroline-5-carboxylate reductase